MSSLLPLGYEKTVLASEMAQYGVLWLWNYDLRDHKLYNMHSSWRYVEEDFAFLSLRCGNFNRIKLENIYPGKLYSYLIKIKKARSLNHSIYHPWKMYGMGWITEFFKILKKKFKMHFTCCRSYNKPWWIYTLLKTSSNIHPIFLIL